MKRLLLGILVWAGSIAIRPAWADMNQAETLAGGGGWSSAPGTYQSFATIGQGMPASSWSMSSANIHWGGFVNAFVMFPDMDLNGNGIADENDPDTDGDGLYDWVELAGTAFDPVTPTDMLAWDTAGNGISDGDEALAGTNPLDPDSAFRLLWVSRDTGDGARIRWSGRGGGRRYQVLAGTSVDTLRQAPEILADVEADGGVAPWYDTLVEVPFVIGTTPHRVFQVRMHTP